MLRSLLSRLTRHESLLEHNLLSQEVSLQNSVLISHSLDHLLNLTHDLGSLSSREAGRGPGLLSLSSNGLVQCLNLLVEVELEGLLASLDLLNTIL